MTRYSKSLLQLSAVAAAAAFATSSFAATDVSANAEYDTGVFNSAKGTRESGVKQGGRIEVNISGKAEGAGGGFVAGKGTAILGMNNAGGGSGSAAGVDDSWVQVGTAVVDVKLGRFEAMDLYPTPGDVYRTSGLYGTNYLRGRGFTGGQGSGAATDRLHAAITANVAPGVSIEIGIIEKKDVTADTSAKGIRPAVSFAAGPVTAKFGIETGKIGNGTESPSFTGYGGTVAAGVGSGITLRANVASGKRKSAPSSAEVKRSSLLLGVDFDTLNVSFETGKTKTAGSPDEKHTAVFAAYAFSLFGIKGATIAPALGYDKVTDAAGKRNLTEIGARIHYDF